MEEEKMQKKLRILCLHSFRTSGEILKKMMGRWPPIVLDKLDLAFMDGPYGARGKSDVEGYYDPPHYEWFHGNDSEGFTEFYDFDECMEMVETFMLKHGPFDGVLGFSQGALLASTFPKMQEDGVALTKVPKIKFLVLISGSRFGGLKFVGYPKLAANAYSSPITCPSLHIIGETDFIRKDSILLLESFADPIAIYHPKGHSVPRLNEESIATLLSFFEKYCYRDPTKESKVVETDPMKKSQIVETDPTKKSKVVETDPIKKS